MKVCLVLTRLNKFEEIQIFVIYFIGEKAAIGDKTLNLKLILCLLCLFICSQFLINEPYIHLQFSEVFSTWLVAC